MKRVLGMGLTRAGVAASCSSSLCITPHRPALCVGATNFAARTAAAAAAAAAAIAVAVVSSDSTIKCDAYNANKYNEWRYSTVLVTGSNRGLGLEFVRQLMENGATVIATCRSPDRAAELKALGVQIEQLDTSDPASVEAMVARLKAQGVTIDVLINNAGIASKNHPVDPIVAADSEDILRVFHTNVVGMVQTTNAVLAGGLMQNSVEPKIVNLSSDLGSIHKTFTAQSAKVKPGGVCSYRISKAASNMASRVFAAELRDKGYTVIALSPGWVQTDMGSSGGRTPPLTPRASIGGMLAVIANIDKKDTGKFFLYDGSDVPW